MQGDVAAAEVGRKVKAGGVVSYTLDEMKTGHDDWGSPGTYTWRGDSGDNADNEWVDIDTGRKIFETVNKIISVLTLTFGWRQQRTVKMLNLPALHAVYNNQMNGE